MLQSKKLDDDDLKFIGNANAIDLSVKVGSFTILVAHRRYKKRYLQ